MNRGHKPLVLVVEDDRALCDSLSLRLTEAGFNSCTAHTASDAISLFDHRHPDAALLDVMLDHSDGLSVCEHIRNKKASIPIIILTGASEGIVREHIHELSTTVGADYHMTKPFDHRLLIQRLTELLAACPGGAYASSRG